MFNFRVSIYPDLPKLEVAEPQQQLSLAKAQRPLGLPPLRRHLDFCRCRPALTRTFRKVQKVQSFLLRAVFSEETE